MTTEWTDPASLWIFLEGGIGWIVAGFGGAGGEAASFGFARWLFLRALGIVYLCAFVSLWVQVDGLLGPRGILPVADWLDAVADRSGGPDVARVPSLFWLDAGPFALHGASAAGVLLSLLLVAGVAPALCLLGLWALYLSFAAVGRVFLSYQWDVLLLEAGFLAILLAPWAPVVEAGGRMAAGLLPGVPGDAPPLALLLLWWLLFRLHFQSGVGKLTSGDETWRDLTALRYHWWTQPLPAWTSWHVSRLPLSVHRAATAATHVLEVAVPLLIFGPRELRLAACGGLVLLQLLIMATGNYNFFNLLAIALALLLVDDAAWSVVGLASPAVPVDGIASGSGVRAAASLLVALPVVTIGAVHLLRSLRPRWSPGGLTGRLLTALQPFRTINSYGLFRVMTTERPEIVVEGSMDGESWSAYEFRWKPGDPTRRPRFCLPHQPRLDWQMWFAALGSLRTSPWFQAFLGRLLEGSEPVLGLLDEVPFDGRPPRYVRAVRYRYRFTDAEERRRTGRWWTRERDGLYAPPIGRA